MGSLPGLAGDGTVGNSKVIVIDCNKNLHLLRKSHTSIQEQSQVYTALLHWTTNLQLTVPAVSDVYIYSGTCTVQGSGVYKQQ